MTTGNRDLRATITIGGGVAASVPRTARDARRELDQLTRAQNDDKAAVAGLRAEMQRLAQAGQRGGAQYRALANQVESATSRIANRTGTIATLNGRLMGTQGTSQGAGNAIRQMGQRVSQSLPQLGGFSSVLGGLGPAGLIAGAGLGVAAGAVVALVAAVSQVGRESTLLLEQARLSATATDDIQRLSFAYDGVTGSIQDARQAAADFAQGRNRIAVGLEFGRAPSQEIQAVYGSALQTIAQGTATDAFFAALQAGASSSFSDRAVTATAAQLGGNQFAEIQSQLLRGEVSLADIRQQVERGEIIPDEILQEQATLQETLSTLGDTITELRTAVVAALIPALEGVVRGLDSIPGVDLENEVRQFDRIEAQRRVREGEFTQAQADTFVNAEAAQRDQGLNLASILPLVRGTPLQGATAGLSQSIEITQTFNGRIDAAEVGDAVLVALSHARLS